MNNGVKIFKTKTGTMHIICSDTVFQYECSQLFRDVGLGLLVSLFFSTVSKYNYKPNYNGGDFFLPIYFLSILVLNDLYLFIIIEIKKVYNSHMVHNSPQVHNTITHFLQWNNLIMHEQFVPIYFTHLSLYMSKKPFSLVGIKPNY